MNEQLPSERINDFYKAILKAQGKPDNYKWVEADIMSIIQYLDDQHVKQQKSMHKTY